MAGDNVKRFQVVIPVTYQVFTSGEPDVEHLAYSLSRAPFRLTSTAEKGSFDLERLDTGKAAVHEALRPFMDGPVNPLVKKTDAELQGMLGAYQNYPAVIDILHELIRAREMATVLLGIAECDSLYPTDHMIGYDRRSEEVKEIVQLFMRILPETTNASST